MKDEGWVRGPEIDVPLEFVGQITGTSAMTKASHVERCATSTRHAGLSLGLNVCFRGRNRKCLVVNVGVV
jgi:hypothetical protein